MEAIKLKARIRDARLEWLAGPPDLPDGEVEVILLYQPDGAQAVRLATEWPALEGGEYRGGSLNREELYGDDGR